MLLCLTHGAIKQKQITPPDDFVKDSLNAFEYFNQ